MSVIIITRNRQQKLLQCLKALSKSSFSKFEVIIIDQSDNEQVTLSSKEYKKKFTKFIYIHSTLRGKSRGLNQALRLVNTPLVVFTDDDCLVDKEWLTTVFKTFTSKPSVSGVFGKTLAYQPEKNIGKVCPAVFESIDPTPHLIKGAVRHWLCGYGNNMAFRTSVFKELGGFKEWLGPGSIGSNAEDAELIVRSLIAGKKLFYNPKMIILHDRWLTLHEIKKQELSYRCGEIACYGYFALKGSRLAKEVIKNNVQETFLLEHKHFFQFLSNFKTNILSTSFWWTVQLFARCKGAIVTIYYFLMQPEYKV